MDTSFVLSHLLNDRHTECARRWIDGLQSSGIIAPLGRLEFHNMLWRKVGFDEFEKQHAERTIQEFEEQINGGWFEVPSIDAARVWERGMGLATLYSGELKVRSLDVWHVAYALECGVSNFWTFDQRQRSLAERVGFKVKPQN
jgi:predicted nucleic acid-binding protein